MTINPLSALLNAMRLRKQMILRELFIVFLFIVVIFFLPREALFAILVFIILVAWIDRIWSKVKLKVKSKLNIERELQLSSLSKNDCYRKPYIFQWKIENFRYCWMKTGEYLESPTFVAKTLNNSRWTLRLFPRGVTNGDHFSICLYRDKHSYGPEIIQVNYKLELLDDDGIISSVDKEDDFKKDGTGCKPTSFMRNRLFDFRKKPYFPKDTLTIQLNNIWKKNEKISMPEGMSARTILQGHLGSFVWRIYNFSTHGDGPISKFMLTNESKDSLINFDLNLKGEYKNILYMDFNSIDEHVKFCSFKVSIIDVDGKKVNIGNHECFGGDLKKGGFYRFDVEEFLKNKLRYFPNDVLFLNCDYMLSTGTVLCERTSCGTISSPVRMRYAENSCTSSLVKDWKFMYRNAILCDVQLRTSKNTFPAHTVVLSARSAVFRKMFSNDMKEKNSGCVDVTDLDDETVQRMLTYAYTDSLEDLQTESASKLYVAGDKYDIPSLKQKCSSFLKENLSPTEACGILVLADMHCDVDLKTAMQNYILEHEKEVFNTPEWEHFMATHLKLAASVMYKKFS